jgi:hypothetical protein
VPLTQRLSRRRALARSALGGPEIDRRAGRFEARGRSLDRVDGPLQHIDRGSRLHEGVGAKRDPNGPGRAHRLGGDKFLLGSHNEDAAGCAPLPAQPLRPCGTTAGRKATPPS